MANTTLSRRDFIDVSRPEDLADALGDARAELKQVQDRVKFIESLIKNTGETKIRGLQYQVAVSYNVVTRRKDWAAIAAKFNPSRQLITAHTSESVSDKIRISALEK